MEKQQHIPNEHFGLLDSGYSNYEDTTELARHRWYYYKEGFSPNLVEKAIEYAQVSKNDLILDPFNGSGTTTLTSSILGYKSIGIEVNPFTSFLSDAKARTVSSEYINRLEEELLRKVDGGLNSPLLGFSTFSRKENLDKWLFNEEVLNSFEGGWEFSKNISNCDAQKVTRLALLSSIMENCNAKKDGKCVRYRRNWDKKAFNKESFIKSLISNLSEIKQDLNDSRIEIKSKVINADSRRVLKSRSFQPNFKLCVTSPPYLNTFDYTDIYRPELFLGKFVKNFEELYNLRLNTIRSHLQAKWERPSNMDFGFLYQQAIKHVEENKDRLMNKNIPLMIQAYFEDMYDILKLLYQKAAKDAQIWFIVSNSAYADREIPVDLIIGDIASKAGWYLKEIGVLRYVQKRKTRHSPNVTELRESVIILSKKKN